MKYEIKVKVTQVDEKHGKVVRNLLEGYKIVGSKEEMREFFAKLLNDKGIIGALIAGAELGLIATPIAGRGNAKAK